MFSLMLVMLGFLEYTAVADYNLMLRLTVHASARLDRVKNIDSINYLSEYDMFSIKPDLNYIYHPASAVVMKN